MSPLVRKPEVITAVPAYNKERTVAPIISEAKRHVDEIIIVNDCSTNHTVEIAQRMRAMAIRHERNKGME